MPFYLHPDIGQQARETGVRITTWHITESEKQLAGLLPPEKHYYAEAVQRFHASGRRREWLATRILLHTELGERGGIAYNGRNKPFLPDAPDKFISISHSAAYACLAIADKPVGIDIEQYGSRAYGLRDKFLSPAEQALLGKDDAERRAVAMWSAKEAAYKLADISRLDLCTDIRITAMASDSISAVIAGNSPDLREIRIGLRYLPDFVMTVCTD